MTTPALLRLREKFPDAQITLLTPEKLREIFGNTIRRLTKSFLAPGESVLAVGKKLRAGKFDLGARVAKFAALGD